MAQLHQGIKGLELWCKSVTSGYTNVEIVNMGNSWRSGLGFCAIIHHFRPDLIDYESLNPEDILGNNTLAYSVAEQHLGIPSLLDPQDMVDNDQAVDRLSILTYLSQFHQAFHSSHPSATSSPSKVKNTASKFPVKGSPLLSNNCKKKETCWSCDKAVFILEKLNVASKTFHRICFKCARCNSQLSIASYYETESGSFCCEICPDEETNRKALDDTFADVDPSESHDSIVDSEKIDPVNENIEESKDVKLEAMANEEEDNTKVEENVSSKEQESVDPTKEVEEKGSPEEENDSEESADVAKVYPDAKNPFRHEENEEHMDHETEGEEEEEEMIKMTKEMAIIVKECIEGVEEAILAKDIKGEEIDNHDSKETVNEGATSESSKITGDETAGDHKSKEAINESEKVTEEKTEEAYEKDNEKGKDEIEEDVKNVKPKKESMNPFGSDFEDDDEDEEDKEVKDEEDKKNKTKISLNPFGSDFDDDDEEEDEDAQHKLTIQQNQVHRKKKRPAPQPPQSPRFSSDKPLRPPPPRPPPPSAEVAKSVKDLDNINRRSQILLAANTSQPTVMVDKSSVGQWKRKKGPAPPRPIPAKREVRKLPRKLVNQELQDIEIKQLEMERQGVKLEKNIRELCKGSSKDSSLNPEAEDLIIQLFDLVNEKNDLVRRQTILIYMKREHRLEEEYADIEHQIRKLMAVPEPLRQDEDKEKEEQLIARLMEIVTQRNEIVDCLELDRLRALEEDESIESHMEKYAAVDTGCTDEVQSKKKKKKKEKEKMKKKKNKLYDADKDIDTKEFPNAATGSASASASSSPIKSYKLKKLNASNLSLELDKEKSKKLKKKILSSLNPISKKKQSS